MYLAENTIVDIINYLNENGVKSRHGNPYHKDSVRRLLTNKRYLGIYKHGDIEVVGGIPQIVDDKVFKDAQDMLEKNKKAPSRLKAVGENYLLTTKLFCGHCLCAMTGDSGHSRNGAIHQYYKCVSRRKRNHCDCKKTTDRKAYIENLVIHGVLDALTDEKIDKMAREISALPVTEGNTDTLK